MNKVYYIIAVGGNYPKPIVEKVVFSDNETKAEINDSLNDYCAEHGQSFAAAVALSEKEFLTIQAMNPAKIK